MAKELPPGVESGHIYRHARFYQNPDSGLWMPKFLLVLAASQGSDVVFRLLTSQSTGRVEDPACSHEDPYPGYYLGVLGPPLGKKSWLDLRGQNDFDGMVFAQLLEKGALKFIRTVDKQALCAALECAAGAEDTTREQGHAIRDQRVKQRCG